MGDTKSSFRARFLKRFNEGKLPPGTAYRFKTRPEAYKKIVEILRREDSRPGETTAAAFAPEQAVQGVGSDDSGHGVAKHGLVIISDGTSRHAAPFYRALATEAKRPDWSKLSDKDAQRRIDKAYSNLLLPRLREEDAELKTALDVPVDIRILWDNPPSKGERRPLVKEAASRERIAAEYPRSGRARTQQKQRKPRPLVGRPAVEDSPTCRLGNLISDHEADVTALTLFCKTKDSANRSVFETNDRDGFFFLTYREARFLVLCDSKHPLRPWVVVDKKMLEGSELVPFVDLTELRTFGLIAGHEYIGKGLPCYGWERLTQEPTLVSNLSRAYHSSLEEYAAVSSELKERLSTEWAAAGLTPEVIDQRKAIIDESLTRLHASLRMLEQADQDGKIDTFAKVELREAMRGFTTAKPARASYVSPVTVRPDKRLALHKLVALRDHPVTFERQDAIGSLPENASMAEQRARFGLEDVNLALKPNPFLPIDLDDAELDQRVTESRHRARQRIAEAERRKRDPLDDDQKQPTRTSERPGRRKSIDTDEKARHRLSRQVGRVTSPKKLFVKGMRLSTPPTELLGKLFEAQKQRQEAEMEEPIYAGSDKRRKRPQTGFKSMDTDDAEWPLCDINLEKERKQQQSERAKYKTTKPQSRAAIRKGKATAVPQQTTSASGSNPRASASASDIHGAGLSSSSTQPGPSSAKKPRASKKNDPEKLDRPNRIFGYRVVGKRLDSMMRAFDSEGKAVKASTSTPILATFLRVEVFSRCLERSALNAALHLYAQEASSNPLLYRRFSSPEKLENLIHTLIDALGAPYTPINNRTVAASRAYAETLLPDTATSERRELASPTEDDLKILSTSKEVDFAVLRAVRMALLGYPAIKPADRLEWRHDATTMAASLLTANKQTFYASVAKYASHVVDTFLLVHSDYQEAPTLLSRTAQAIASKSAARDQLAELLVKAFMIELVPVDRHAQRQTQLSSELVALLKKACMNAIVNTKIFADMPTDELAAVSELQERFATQVLDVIRTRNERIVLIPAPVTPQTDEQSVANPSAVLGTTASSSKTPAKRKETAQPGDEAGPSKKPRLSTSNPAREPDEARASKKPRLSTDAPSLSEGSRSSVRPTRQAARRSVALLAQTLASEAASDSVEAEPDFDDESISATRVKVRASSKVARRGREQVKADEPARQASTAEGSNSRRPASVRSDDDEPEGVDLEEDETTTTNRFACGKYELTWDAYDPKPDLSVASLTLRAFLVSQGTIGGFQTNPDLLIGAHDHLKRCIGGDKGISILYEPIGCTFNAEHLFKAIVKAAERVSDRARWLGKYETVLNKLENSTRLPHCGSQTKLFYAVQSLRALQPFRGRVDRPEFEWLQDLRQARRHVMYILDVQDDRVTFLHGRKAFLVDTLFDTDMLPGSHVPTGQISVTETSVQIHCYDTGRYYWPSTVRKPAALEAAKTCYDLVLVALDSSASTAWIDVRLDAIYLSMQAKEVLPSVAPPHAIATQGRSTTVNCRLRSAKAVLKAVERSSDLEEPKLVDGLPYWRGCKSPTSQIKLCEFLLKKPFAEWDRKTVKREILEKLDRTILIGDDMGEAFPHAFHGMCFAADGKPVALDYTVTRGQLAHQVKQSTRRLELEPLRQAEEQLLRARNRRSFDERFCREVLETFGVLAANGKPRRRPGMAKSVDELLHEDLLSSERRSTVFFIGRDAPKSGKQRGRHSAVFRNSLLRALEQYCRRQELDVMFVMVDEWQTSRRCPCCHGWIQEVEYVEGDTCFRLRDCPTSGRRLHRDVGAAQNMILAALGDLFVDGARWWA